MLSLMERLIGRRVKKSGSSEVKCLCGEIAIHVPEEKMEIYLCQKCNKLLYYAVPTSIFKIKPFSLGWLKRKKKH